jgi:vacuolar-type H+-ATPase subunit H
MKTIELIRDAEEKSATKILDAQNEAVKAIKEAKQKNQQKIDNVRTELTEDIKLILDNAGKKAQRVKEESLENHNQQMTKINNLVKKNSPKAISFIFNKIINK